MLAFRLVEIAVISHKEAQKSQMIQSKHLCFLCRFVALFTEAVQCAAGANIDAAVCNCGCREALVVQFVDREHFRRRYMLPLLAAGWLAMTISDKPRSSKQRYLVTPEGEDALSVTAQVADDEER